MNSHEFQQYVRLRRDEPATALQFAPCIERLIDDELCRSVGNVMQSCGAYWERYVAHDNLHAQLPAERGVYMFVWRPRITFPFGESQQQSLPWILYVGKAGITEGVADTLLARYKTYQKFIGKPPDGLWERKPPFTREERLSRYLALRPLEYWFTILKDASEIARLERHLIKLFRPPLNAQHAGRLRPGRPTPAF